MNITELARRTRIPTQKLKLIIPELGFDVGLRAIKVDDRVAQEILKKLSDPRVRMKYLSGFDQQDEEVEESKAVHAGTIIIGEEITVREFADSVQQPVTKVIFHLMKNGIMAAQNDRIDFATASITAEDFGYTVEKARESHAMHDESRDIKQELRERHAHTATKQRPPVVVVMGHVDHGKTTLLDAIRETHVTEQEAGRITQHIGAYQVERNGRMITCIDTPGHEAFTAMRSRGAKIADIAILVVAADDGVQPQTLEALTHIRKMDMPFVVAINKIDRESANPDKIKNDLSEVGVAPEEWGGKVPFVPVSALKGTGLSELLDVVLLLAELHADQIIADYSSSGVGTIIESHIDRGIGPVATVLMQSGVLRVGDYVQVGDVLGKIRSMTNDRDVVVGEALPSMPVQIQGLKGLPAVGEVLEVAVDDAMRKKQHKSAKRKGIPLALQQHSVSSSGKSRGTTKEVRLIIKADVLGSVEALKEALRQFESGPVAVAYHFVGLGPVTESDVERASQSESILLAFNVDAPLQIVTSAKEKNVPLTVSRVIYDLVDVVQEKVKEGTEPVVTVKSLGSGKVVQVFSVKKRAVVIGVRVTQGILRAGTIGTLSRNNESVGEGKVGELRSGKQQVNEVAEGAECGLLLEGVTDAAPGDVFECIVREEKK